MVGTGIAGGSEGVNVAVGAECGVEQVEALLVGRDCAVESLSGRVLLGSRLPTKFDRQDFGVDSRC